MLPPCVWSTSLQRTFTSFPSGWVGAALLVLRGVVGASAMVEAILAAVDMSSALGWAACASAALSGLALVLGFLTPIVSSFLAAAGATILLSMPASTLLLLDSRMALLEFVVMAGAVAVLGPGAASIDARLFGRREVAISEKRRPNDL
jgi:uncharacterized membrane protein YphA (DoxX/SURF4 family)